MFAFFFKPRERRMNKRREYTRLRVESLEDRTAPAVFTVNTIGDLPDANVGDGLAQDAAGNTSLRAAIQEGNAHADADIGISFKLPIPSTITLGSALEALNKNFTISAAGPASITVEGGGAAGAFRVFSVNAGKGVYIGDLTITQGAAIGNAEPANSGGGILNNGTLHLFNVHLHHNQAQYGGAINNLGLLEIEYSQLYLNTGLQNGGAIHNGPTGTAVVGVETRITSNNAPHGGGIYNYQGSLTIDSGSEVNSNTATTGYGGGIYNNGGTVSMSDAFLNGNTAAIKGGGLYADGGTVTFTYTSIQGNNAPDPNNGKGGGIYVRRGTVTLVSGCTLAGNTCGVTGGGNGGCWHPDGTLNTNPLDNTIGVDPVVDPNP